MRERATERHVVVLSGIIPGVYIIACIYGMASSLHRHGVACLYRVTLCPHLHHIMWSGRLECRYQGGCRVCNEGQKLRLPLNQAQS